MAFGDLLGSLTGGTNDIGTTQNVTGSVSVAVGDLVVAAFAEFDGVSVTTLTDNLGNTYTAQNAGSDGGQVGGRAYYSRVTNAGTLTTVTAAASNTQNDWALSVAVFEGSFAAPPLDASPANTTADTTSPHTCPATGTLAQADELVIGWLACTRNRTHSGSGSTSLGAQAESVAADGTADAVSCAVGYQVVAATTSVEPALASNTNPTDIVLGTMSFKKSAVAGNNQGLMMLFS